MLSHQFSFGINGGVQQVILACNIALEINPLWAMLDLDSKNVQTFWSRNRREEEFEMNVVYHYMPESFRALYGNTLTVQWHFGSGPDRAATSFHLSCKGLRQGDALAIIQFDIVVARVYRKQQEALKGKGVFVAIAENVKILAPAEVIGEIAERFPVLAWEEAGLTTQTVKNRIFVQPKARANWRRYMELAPRNELFELPVHEIPNGSERVDPFDEESERVWLEEDGVNILGNPSGRSSSSPPTSTTTVLSTYFCYNSSRT